MDKDLERRLFLAFVTKGDRDWSTELRLADDLYARYLDNIPYPAVIQQFLNLFFAVNFIHKPLEKDNKPRSVGVMNMIQEHLSEQLGIDHAQEVPDSYIDSLWKQAADFQQESDPKKLWFVPKLQNLAWRLYMWKQIHQWINRLAKRVSPLVVGLEIEQIHQAAQEVWSRTTSEREYGVKTCYFHSPLFLAGRDVFHVFDEKLGLEDAKVIDIAPENTFAYLGIGSRPQTKISPQPYESIRRLGVQNLGVMIEGVRFIFAIDNTGGVRTALGYIPIKRAFDKVGAASIFELLRLFLLMRLHDLTRGADLVNKLPSIDETEKDAGKKEGGILGIGAKRKRLDYMLLAVPRTKPANRIKKPVAEEGTRFIDRHHVTWFVRRLPEGYHASQRAVDFAASHGVTLGPGTTIVREHWRGQVGDQSNRPTKAVFRRTKA